MKLTEIDLNHTKTIINEGITHIDDQSVPIDKFLYVVKHLHKFEITEKVDGANLKFGFDNNNRFFTTRDGKEGGYYYDQDDWGTEFKDTGFKSAHAALQSQESLFHTLDIAPSTIIEAEILFGDKPNAIPYWPNQIIMLRLVQGEADLDEINDALDGKTIEVSVHDVPYTEDGYTLQTKSEDHRWSFEKVKQYEPDMAKIASSLKKHIATLENFLYQPNIANFEVTGDDGMAMPSNIEVLALRTSKKTKEAKELILDVVDGKRDPITGKRTGKDGMRHLIKDELLTQLVRNAQSSLGPTIEDGGWIEGVVLKRTGDDGDEMWKIVDKGIFTSVNKFNHQIRSLISDKHKGYNTPASSAGLLGNMLRDMATETGHSAIGTTQAKRYVKKFGATKGEILRDLSDGMHFHIVKEEWPKIIDTAHGKLHDMLDTYKESQAGMEFVDDANRTHKYDDTIHVRTLQVFASLFKQMQEWTDAIYKARKSEELLMILIGDKLP